MPRERKRESGEDWYRYALALEASQEGFRDWDLVANRLFGSRRWQSITGVQESCTSLDCWMERVHPHDKPRFEAELRAVRAGKAKTVRNEHRIQRADGEWRWVLARGVVAQDGAERLTHVTGSPPDNTERRMADPLTGLPNRLFFLDYLERRMERARLRGDWGYVVLAVALDRFDQVNETLGCCCGDRLLMETAQRLHARLPESSVVARLNGPALLVCLETIHYEAGGIVPRALCVAWAPRDAAVGHWNCDGRSNMLPSGRPDE